MIDEFFISHLNNHEPITAITEEIAVGQAPVWVDPDGNTRLTKPTYIWISTYDEEDLMDLDGETGITRYRFDVEVCSTSDRTAKRLGRVVKKYLQGSGGYGEIFGTVMNDSDILVNGEVLMIEVNSKDDDYVPVNQFSQDEITVVAFDVTITAEDSIDDVLTQ